MSTFHTAPLRLSFLFYLLLADLSRKAFQARVSARARLSLGTCTGHITINRSRIYEHAIETYLEKPNLANHFSDMFVSFTGEEAVDFGGVSRDFFSGFWEEAYKKMFDGAALLTPACHADVDVDQFEVLGRILSHGYLCCGFIPTRITFPVLAFALLGLSNRKFCWSHFQISSV